MNYRKKFNSPSGKLRVLIAPLDWGLGHATRCIPIIHELRSEGCEIFIAADGPTASLLKTEFPGETFLPLAGYHIKYGKNERDILLQVPTLFITLFRERRWLKKTIKHHGIDAVISDNRPGLYNRRIISIYITHQLTIKTHNLFTAKIAQLLHRHFINKYDECWIPDYKENGLAGELSHPDLIPRNAKYIGALSRFEKNPGVVINYDLLILLSGPEPQRSTFENLILSGLKNLSGKRILLIRGLPGDENVISSGSLSVNILNHLSSTELNNAIEASDLVLTRTGYTTIMDMVKLQKKCIMVPTPGQSEQEYLADHLNDKKIFFVEQQNKFSLPSTLKAIINFHFDIPVIDTSIYKNAISNLVKSLYSSQTLVK